MGQIFYALTTMICNGMPYLSAAVLRHLASPICEHWDWYSRCLQMQVTCTSRTSRCRTTATACTTSALCRTPNSAV